MESNELRIGNLVHDYDEELIIVSGISYGDVYSSKLGETPLARIKPILLTEEWLIKFGFEKKINEWMKNSIVLEYINNNLFFSAGLGLSLSVQIKQVHQLQNLYFALTGQELNIK
jgi:hypothetical protein